MFWFGSFFVYLLFYFNNLISQLLTKSRKDIYKISYPSRMEVDLFLTLLSCVNMIAGFKVCKSLHHHSFKLKNQPDAATSQVYYL
jgi:hypothetical protein